MSRNTFQKFQQKVWDELPERKHLAGQEKVFDIVAAAIQEWPVEEYSAAYAEDDKAGMLRATRRLNKAIKRHMAALYGDTDFQSIWIVFLNVVVSMVIRYIIEWWLNNKTHQKQLLFWRRKWVTPREEN